MRISNVGGGSSTSLEATKDSVEPRGVPGAGQKNVARVVGGRARHNSTRSGMSVALSRIFAPPSNRNCSRAVGNHATADARGNATSSRCLPLRMSLAIQSCPFSSTRRQTTDRTCGSPVGPRVASAKMNCRPSSLDSAARSGSNQGMIMQRTIGAVACRHQTP